MKQSIYCNSGDDTELTTWENYSHVMIEMDNGQTGDQHDTIHGQFTPDDAYSLGQQLMASAVKVWKDGRPEGLKPPFEVSS